jgi:hypothetical protein
MWGCNGAWGGFSSVALLMIFARFCHVMTCFSTLFHLGVLASRSLKLATPLLLLAKARYRFIFADFVLVVADFVEMSGNFVLFLQFLQKKNSLLL